MTFSASPSLAERPHCVELSAFSQLPDSASVSIFDGLWLVPKAPKPRIMSESRLAVSERFYRGKPLYVGFEELKGRLSWRGRKKPAKTPASYFGFEKCPIGNARLPSQPALAAQRAGFHRAGNSQLRSGCRSAAALSLPALSHPCV